MVLSLKYVGLAPGFAKEVLEFYESWEGKEAVPWKFKELMLVLRIEVAKRYKPHVRAQDTEKPKIMILRDSRLD
jgi:hypothetical protein